MNRILDFNDFLFDKLFENEDKTAIILSDRLYSFLSNISHPLAQELQLFNKTTVESSKATLIDLDDKKMDCFTYIIPSKLKEYLNKELKSDYLDDELHNYKKLFLLGADIPRLWKVNRTSIKIGKLINKLFPNKYDPVKDIETFVDKIKVERNRSEEVFGRFKIVSGDNIVKYYNSHMYDPSSVGSTLGGSCMRYNSCKRFIEFYAKNPGVSLVILMSEENPDKIMGRALLWDIEYINGDKVDRKFMDRIYYVYSQDMNYFKEYAARKGWLYKKKQNMSSHEEIVDTLTDVEETMELRTTNNFVKNSAYPYMDTMKYFYHQEKYLSNYSGLEYDYIFMESTSGDFEIHGSYDRNDDGEDHTGQIYVDHYDRWINEDELRFCELGNEWRTKDDAVYVEYYGEFATEDWVEDNMVYSNQAGFEIPKEEATYSTYYNDYIPIDDVVEVLYVGAAAEESIEDIDKYNVDELYSEDTDSFIVYDYKNDKGYSDRLCFNSDDSEYFVETFLVSDPEIARMSHLEWDKDMIFMHKGKYYYNDDDVKKDEMIGQKRLWND